MSACSRAPLFKTAAGTPIEVSVESLEAAAARQILFDMTYEGNNWGKHDLELDLKDGSYNLALVEGLVRKRSRQLFNDSIPVSQDNQYDTINALNHAPMTAIDEGIDETSSKCANDGFDADYDKVEDGSLMLLPYMKTPTKYFSTTSSSVCSSSVASAAASVPVFTDEDEGSVNFKRFSDIDECSSRTHHMPPPRPQKKVKNIKMKYILGRSACTEFDEDPMQERNIFPSIEMGDPFLRAAEVMMGCSEKKGWATSPEDYHTKDEKAMSLEPSQLPG